MAKKKGKDSVAQRAADELTDAIDTRWEENSPLERTVTVDGAQVAVMLHGFDPTSLYELDNQMPRLTGPARHAANTVRDAGAAIVPAESSVRVTVAFDDDPLSRAAAGYDAVRDARGTARTVVAAAMIAWLHARRDTADTLRAHSGQVVTLDAGDELNDDDEDAVDGTAAAAA